MNASAAGTDGNPAVDTGGGSKRKRPNQNQPQFRTVDGKLIAPRSVARSRPKPKGARRLPLQTNHSRRHPQSPFAPCISLAVLARRIAFRHRPALFEYRFHPLTRASQYLSPMPTTATAGLMMRSSTTSPMRMCVEQPSGSVQVNGSVG